MASKEKAKKTFPKKKEGSSKTKTKKAKKILFKAPEDFKPSFFEVMFETLRDGCIRGSTFSALRVKGKWDNADNPRYDLAEYDAGTSLAIATRISAAAHAANVLKRLPPKEKFGLVLRVNKRSADGSLAVSLKGARQLVVGKNDKLKWKWFEDKKDPTYRKIRKAIKLLPSAFVEVKLPPKGKRKGKKDED